jgi:hypothetical protein
VCADVESDLVTVQMWRTTDEGLVFPFHQPLRRCPHRLYPSCVGARARSRLSLKLWIKPGDEAVGHVAVPVARVQESSSEEGWYEIRSRDGSLVTGDDVGVEACVKVG